MNFRQNRKCIANNSFRNNKKCNVNNSLLNYIGNHQYLFVWIAVYVFLVSSGLRYDFLFSLVTSTVCIISMLFLDRLVRLVLIRKLLKHHHQILYYLVSFVIIHFLIYGTVAIETLIFKYFYNRGLISLPENFTEEYRIYPYFKVGIMLLGTFFVSTVSFLLNRNKDADIKTDLLMNEKLDMELRYLKAQINPHFLFNALNNIYSLVYTNDDNAAESILKLSEMLRYVTDECQTDRISISKEIKYIENFIDFQTLRMEVHPNIEFHTNIYNPEFKIPPMILQPMVENAFKHSRLENNRDGYVKITINQKDSNFEFITENSQSTFMNNNKERSGIGIANVRKRLDLVFGNNYKLLIDNNDKYYKVELKVNVKNNI